MDPATRTIFEKSIDPAHGFVVRLDDIVRETIDEGSIPPPERLVRVTEEVEKIGDELSRRDLLHDALRVISLKERRKKAGIRKDSDRFAPFAGLVGYVRREGEMAERRSEEEKAMEEGLSFLRQYEKTVLPGLQGRLDVYGLRAGKLYREGDKAAWIPFSWESGIRKENKVVTLKIDHASRTHKILCCHPVVFKKIEIGDEDKATKALVESATDHFSKDIRSYRPLTCQDKFRNILRVFYKTGALVTDHGLRMNGSLLTEDLLFVGFFVSTNKNAKIKLVYFERPNGKIICYKYNAFLLGMLLRKATLVLETEAERPAKRARE